MVLVNELKHLVGWTDVQGICFASNAFNFKTLRQKKPGPNLFDFKICFIFMNRRSAKGRDYVRWKENFVKRSDVGRENSYARDSDRERCIGNREMRQSNWQEKGNVSGLF